MSLDFFKENNKKSILKKEDRKNCIKKEGEERLKKDGFNPRKARHRSNKGLVMRRNDFKISLAIQLLPIALITVYFLSKLFY